MSVSHIKAIIFKSDSVGNVPKFHDFMDNYGMGYLEKGVYILYWTDGKYHQEYQSKLEKYYNATDMEFLSLSLDATQNIHESDLNDLHKYAKYKPEIKVEALKRLKDSKGANMNIKQFNDLKEKAKRNKTTMADAYKTKDSKATVKIANVNPAYVQKLAREYGCTMAVGDYGGNNSYYYLLEGKHGALKSLIDELDNNGVLVKYPTIKDSSYMLGYIKSGDVSKAKEKANIHNVTIEKEGMDYKANGKEEDIKSFLKEVFPNHTYDKDRLIKDSYTTYKGYDIEYNFYGKGEYTVQYDGDDVWFKSKAEAKKFIDDVTKGRDSIKDAVSMTKIVKTLKAMGYDSTHDDYKGAMEQFHSIIRKNYNNDDKSADIVYSELQKLYNQHKGEADWDTAWKILQKQMGASKGKRVHNDSLRDGKSTGIAYPPKYHNRILYLVTLYGLRHYAEMPKKPNPNGHWTLYIDTPNRDVEIEAYQCLKAIEKELGVGTDSIHDVDPAEGESKADFIARFMNETKSEYPDEKQRYAVANSYWERRGKDSVTDSVSLKSQLASICAKHTNDFGVHVRNDLNKYEIRLGEEGKNYGEKIAKDIERTLKDKIYRIKVEPTKLNDIRMFVDVYPNEKIKDSMHDEDEDPQDDISKAKEIAEEIYNKYIKPVNKIADINSNELFNIIKSKFIGAKVIKEKDKLKELDISVNKKYRNGESYAIIFSLYSWDYGAKPLKQCIMDIYDNNRRNGTLLKLKDSVKDGIPVEVLAVEGKFGDYYVLKVKTEDGYVNYMVTNEYNHEKIFNKGYSFLFSKQSAIKEAKGLSEIDKLKAKYGEAEAIRRWKAGERDSVRDYFNYKNKVNTKGLNETVLQAIDKAEMTRVELEKWLEKVQDKYGIDLAKDKDRYIAYNNAVGMERIMNRDSIHDEDLDSLSEEEKQAIEDYKEAISGTQDVKLLELYSHILREEIEHLRELNEAKTEDSIHDKESASVREAIALLEGDLANEYGYTLDRNNIIYGNGRKHPISTQVYLRLKELGYDKASMNTSNVVSVPTMSLKEMQDYCEIYRCNVTQVGNRKYKLEGSDANTVIKELKGDGFIKDSVKDDNMVQFINKVMADKELKSVMKMYESNNKKVIEYALKCYNKEYREYRNDPEEFAFQISEDIIAYPEKF